MLSLALVLLLVSGCAPLSIRRRSPANQECGHVKRNVLISPKYPHDYPTNISCVYSIHLNRNEALKLTFRHFDIESSVKCSFDYLEVKDIEVSYGKYCGHTLQGNSMVIEDTPFVNIVFRSDKTLSKTGFKIDLEFLNKGHDYGGHEVATVTVANTEAPPFELTTPFHPSTKSSTKIPKTNATDLQTTSMQETTLSPTDYEVESTVTPTTGANPEVVISTGSPFTEKKPFQSSPLTTGANPDILTTKEPNPTTSETNELTELKPTSEPHVEEFVTTTESNIPITTPHVPTTPKASSRTSSQPSQTMSNDPEFSSAKREKNLKLEVSNDNSEEDPSATMNSTRSTITSNSSLNESFPTEFPMGNESVVSSNVTGNESVPTEATEITPTTDELNTVPPTLGPEPTNYKPEAEKHVLDKLKLMELLQRIKFAALQMEELLIGKIVEEEVSESQNSNEAKRGLDDFRYGINSYLGFRNRIRREVKRNLGQEFMDEIYRIEEERKAKKRTNQEKDFKPGQ